MIDQNLINNNDFQQNKIKTLNKFFMRSIIMELLFSFLFFCISILVLYIISIKIEISIEFKITIISISITYLTSTSKDLINKILMLAEYKTELLIEEQRALNKNIGIDVDKINLDNNHEQQK